VADPPLLRIGADEQHVVVLRDHRRDRVDISLPHRVGVTLDQILDLLGPLQLTLSSGRRRGLG
jgi:hypothetical protein